MNELLEGLIARVAQAENGDRPAALRAFGDAAGMLDAAEWIDTRPQVLKRLKIKAAEIDALRADGRKAAEEAERAKAALAAAAAGETEEKPGYVIRQGITGGPVLLYRKMTGDGPQLQTLAHFVPRVTGERVRHRADGGRERVFVCELTTARGVVAFDALPEDLADSKRFYAVCLHAAGADARLGSLAGVKHLPAAAMELAAEGRERTETFEFTGWHEHNGRLVYLSAGGTIGAQEPLTVDLSGLAAGTGFPPLANFGPRDDGDAALAHALAALAGPVRQCLGDAVMLPQLAAVGLAPLLRWAPIGELPVIHMMGVSGKGKTRAAHIVQAFYGLNKPAASWGWTQAAIEVVSSALRDCAVCIDDLKASTCDPRIAVKTMQRWADRRPRVRSNRSGSGLIGSPHIASLMLSNGEDLPAGEASVAARALFIAVGDEASNEEAFLRAEAAVDTLPTMTARYIAWLIQEKATMPARIGASFLAARKRYMSYIQGKTRINDSGRVASSCALLETGADILTQFLQTVGWNEMQAAEWVAATRVALEDLALGQASRIDLESVARLFLSSVAALLDCHKIELQPVNGKDACPTLVSCNPMKATARLVGWRRGDEVMLDMNLALPAVREWLRRQGAGQGIERDGLYAQLRSGQYLLRWDKEQTLVNQKLDDGHTRRVLSLKSASLHDQGEPNKETAGA